MTRMMFNLRHRRNLRMNFFNVLAARRISILVTPVP
jgi:hypothetical protein